jgi:hypothetical protein
MGITRDEWEKRFQVWKTNEGAYIPTSNDSDYEQFLFAIKNANTIKDLVSMIDEFDPYNYKIYHVRSGGFYQGVKIKIQFHKGKKIYMVPKDHLQYLEVKMTSTGTTQKVGFFLIKNNVKNDSHRSVSKPIG